MVRFLSYSFNKTVFAFTIIFGCMIGQILCDEEGFFSSYMCDGAQPGTRTVIHIDDSRCKAYTCDDHGAAAFEDGFVDCVTGSSTTP
ncbi:hypothetical protein BX666DRAFT_1904840 [Dichotomocladium elegans]|nr:hypothetical protein BX666DRAFT_1904840 [Dichotomocladium elegans]